MKDQQPTQGQAIGQIRFSPRVAKKTNLDRLVGILAKYNAMAYIDSIPNGLAFGSHGVYLNTDNATFSIFKNGKMFYHKVTLDEAYDFLVDLVSKRDL